jgi:uncharacterized protein (TIGR03118 family)
MNALARLAAVGTVVAALAFPAAASAHGYRQINLVSDIPGMAALTDPSLVNPWGVSAGPDTPLWVSDNGTDVSTLYAGAVHGMPVSAVPLVVSIPGGAPTGQVFNPTTQFVLHQGDTSTPAKFIFDSEAGMITAWSPDLVPITSAVTVQTTPGAVYKGLAIDTVPGKGPFLYAANFSQNRIDVFNRRFHRVNSAFGFHDPTLPAGFAPFNIQAIGLRLFVAYAKQDAAHMDEIAGPGLGFVDVYGPRGHLLRRLVSRGRLNAPWGLVVAPAKFGRFSHALLVGNFGNGHINAYDPMTGVWLGQLRHPDDSPIVIDGLWALRFGNPTIGGTHGLLFSAGIDDEAHGLLGVIRHVTG